jgi:acetyltransferase-like isoleucine patch superfamily enzyme
MGHHQDWEWVHVFPHVRIEPNAVVGNFALLLSTVAHDVDIGDFAVISPNCTLVGGCRIERDAFIGSNVVLTNITVGENAYVGAGSIVIKDVKPGTKVFGNPARVSAF